MAAFDSGLLGVKVSTALDYSSASTVLAGNAIDMSGYQGCLIIVKMATIEATAVTSIKAQTDTTSAFASAQDIEGSSMSIAADDDDQIFIIDVKNPPERYLRVYLTRGTAAAACSAVYVQYGPDTMPQTNDVTDEVTTETHIWADNGTA
jgi:hypothetical protein